MKTYEINFTWENLDGKLITEKTEWTGDYENALEVERLFTEMIMETTPYHITKIHVKRKEEKDNE